MNTNIRVLIVDDEPIVGERLKASLERSGFLVDTCTSGEDAIGMLRENDYNILVTDLKMSEPDGIEVLRIARQIRPALKSIVITGFATMSTAEEARRSGAVEFIAKPFKMSHLKEVLIKLSESEHSAGD